MKICKKCQAPFKGYNFIDGKYRNLNNRQFCLECSPFGEKNNKDLTKNLLKTKHPSRKTYKNVKNFRYNRKIKSIEYLGGKCKICGYEKCKTALHFHHLDPKEKAFGISSKASWGFEKIKSELDKCILLCSNCHAEIHEGITFLK